MAKKKKTSKGQSRLKLSRVIDTRVIYCGDNLPHLKKLPTNSIDLVYIDPPFNSNRNYEVFWGETGEKRSFQDRHASIEAYIDFMRPRCEQLARVLKPSGSFYYHCDWHAGHYIKVLLDQLLGPNNFRNQITWKRSYSHNDGGQFGRVCDYIFYYSGGGTDWVFNPEYQSYEDDYIASEYRHVDTDGRHYKESDVTAAKPGGDTEFAWHVKRMEGKGNSWSPDLTDEYRRPLSGWEYKAVPPYNGRYWAYSKDNLIEYWEQGKLKHRSTGMPRLKLYADEMPGVPIQDLWTDIAPLSSQARERTGYPTQKPLPLLERIIRASSNEGDVVLDAFCGCGTALEASEKLNRQWIGIDVSPTACRVMAKRLRDRCSIKQDEVLWRADRGFVVRDLPWTETRLRNIPPFEFENWAVIALANFQGVEGIANRVKVGDMGIDGRLYPMSQMESSKKGASGEQLEFTLDMYYPVQVKQKSRVGRPDIDQFETAMRRVDSKLGFFVSFGFTAGAEAEMRRFEKKEGRQIIPITVDTLLENESLKRWA